MAAVHHLVRQTETLVAEDESDGRVRRGQQSSAVELCPVDTGNLEASTRTLVGRSGTVFWGELAFATPYASRVHELRMSQKGDKTKSKPGNRIGPAGPKWLERTLRFYSKEWRKEMKELLG